MSAPEHAVPERFFNDPAQCNLQGASNPTAGLPDCPQGISAVKALGIAAAQGQRIYTITQKVYNDNPGIVNTALSAHSYDTQSRVQQSLDAGYEVTIHESPIAESGWAGAGYMAIDPNTGAGAYTIEGGHNGGSLDLDFAQRYLDWVCAHMITDGLILGAVGLLSPFLPVTKALFDLKPLLGDKNPYTTILRGLALTMLGSGLITAFAGTVGPFLAPIAITLLIFVGFYNLTILLQGIFYAKLGRGNDFLLAASDGGGKHWDSFFLEKPEGDRATLKAGESRRTQC